LRSIQYFFKKLLSGPATSHEEAAANLSDLIFGSEWLQSRPLQSPASLFPQPTPAAATTTAVSSSSISSTTPLSSEDKPITEKIIEGEHEAKTQTLNTFATNRDAAIYIFAKNRQIKPLQTSDGLQGQLFAIRKHYVSVERLTEIGDLGIPLHVFVGTEDNVRISTTIVFHTNLKLNYFLFCDGSVNYGSLCTYTVSLYFFFFFGSSL
jgi:hypothetical protein